MFNKKIYDIDWRRLVIWQLSTDERKPKLIALLLALVSAVAKVHNDLMGFRKARLYELSITPQVCFLELALNDKYDLVARRIRITAPIRRLPVFIYKRSENKPVFIFRRAENKPKLLYTKAETARAGVDFIIKVPFAVSFNSAEMTAFVKAYALPSKRFKISVI